MYQKVTNWDKEGKERIGLGHNFPRQKKQEGGE